MGQCAVHPRRQRDGAIAPDKGVLEVCPYGVTSCIVCDPQCVRVAGETSFCGDGKIDVVAGESCDDGNAETGACPEGVDDCAVCDVNCQDVIFAD